MNYSKAILPGETIGIIGGGQLGRMLAFSAQGMGYTVGILDPQVDCPAGQVANWQVVADYSNLAALEEMAERCDVVTYEFENIDADALASIREKVFVPQGVDVLRITQDRQLEKQFLSQHGFPVARFDIVEDVEALERAATVIGYPSVLKTIRGGYDGHGQVVLKTEKDLVEAGGLLASGTCVLEEWVTYQKEASVMVSRNLAGEIVVFPVAENQHRYNILHQSIVPARISQEVEEEIQELAKTLAERLNLCGLLGIELFLGDQVYINELAPRPHNSGHYSIEACDFSQFDSHILSVCQRPLPVVRLLQSAVMVNILGQHQEAVCQEMLQKPEWHVHLYGKGEAKTNRKMGHLTILTDDQEATLSEIIKTSIWD